MFNIFRPRAKSEQEKNILKLYKQCVYEIEGYVESRPEPNREDIIKVAINAKIAYDLFQNAKYIEPAAKKKLSPLILNAWALFVQIDGMEQADAAEKFRFLAKEAYDNIRNKNDPDLIFPSVYQAFIMLRVIGIDDI